MRERARKGAEATARRHRGGGLDPNDLPPLRSPQDAERWAETVGRAVAEKRLTHAEGRAVASLLREFLKAHADGRTRDRIDQLQAEVDAFKSRRGGLGVVK